MSDLEQRLADALLEAAQGAPSAPGLARAARSRAQARRRNRLVAVAAVVALCVGVPAAVVATRGSGGGQPGPGPSNGTVAKDPSATGQELPGGFHYESWHDVTIQVPDTWQYGGATDWCADGGTLEPPRISRPGVTLSIGCTPAQGYGVSFQQIDNTDDFEWPLTRQDPDSWPADAYVGARGLDGVLVQVALPDLVLAQQILDSAQHNALLDPHGCPVEAASDPVVPGDSMTVCRFDDTGLLEQSELLTGPDLDAAEAALQAAPVATAVDCDAKPGQTLRLASVAEDARIDLSCDTLLVHGEARQLTADVLYWALSPGWSGSVPHGVSLPSELRKP